MVFIDPHISQYLQDHFHNTSNQKICQDLEIPIHKLHRLRKEMGLRKSEEHIRQKQTTNATGRIMSPESKALISKAHKGRKHTPEALIRIRATRNPSRGENHYAWKGGVKTRFSDPRYQTWRLGCLARDAYTCQKCSATFRPNQKGLHVHHIVEYAKNIDLRYDLSNGQTLCKACHMTVHNKTVPAPKIVACKCGCGTLFEEAHPITGRKRSFVNGHGRRKSKLECL